MTKNRTNALCRLGCILLALVFILLLTPAANAAPAVLTDYTVLNGYTAPAIKSGCAYVIEVNTGTVLYAKQPDEMHPPASTLKVLTALLAVENCELDETVTFSYNAIHDIEEGGNNYDFKEGETMSLRSCLEIMILSSSNEAAYAAAEHVSGSVADFATRMNRRAQVIGCTNSNFMNPNGLNNEFQYSTARDMALIFAECVRNPAFLAVSALESCCVTDATIRTAGYAYANHDKMMLENSEFRRDYVVCGKTGYTSLAGNTLLTYARQGGMDIVCAILDGNGYEDVYNDTISLCEYAFSKYTMLYTAALADAQVEDELGECNTQYGIDSVLLPFWVSEDEVTCQVTELSKEIGAQFSGRVNIQVGDAMSVSTVVTSLPLTQIFYAADFEPEASPTPTVEPEPSSTAAPETAGEDGWLLVIHICAAGVFLLCIVGILTLHGRLKREEAARKKAAFDKRR